MSFMLSHSAVIDERCALSDDALAELRDRGFIVIPGPVAEDRLAQFADTYDRAVTQAHPDDVHVGSTTTRVNDFVNRGAEFDCVYTYGPILSACCHIIGQPFKLSSFHARTVRPYSAVQQLHVDYKRDVESGWPLVGFILMVDEFRADNGATRFVPGSHEWECLPSGEGMNVEVACGPAGSVLIYNGSVWHGHSANPSSEPRRSIQGAFIRRNAEAAIDHAARIGPETFDRINDLAKYLLAV
jgi:ectoine hydroxylase-related dioxygenase (phytanoyl-CoA dioxygenase family)